jgi:hypothetical protein
MLAGEERQRIMQVIDSGLRSRPVLPALATVNNND